MRNFKSADVNNRNGMGGDKNPCFSISEVGLLGKQPGLQAFILIKGRALYCCFKLIFKILAIKAIEHILEPEGEK